MANLRKIINFPFILVVKIYQYIFSPLFPATCRFTPTCSSYTIDAITIWGPIKGIYLGVKRISKCHPWGNHGHDPVPEKHKNK